MTKGLSKAAKAAKAQAWADWKQQASPALRKHAETVESCTLCNLRPGFVADAFMRPNKKPASFHPGVLSAYAEIKDSQPERGPLAAEFAAKFRAEHHHGPSIRHVCQALGWGDQPNLVRSFIVHRLIKNGWLVNTTPVPWTLRPSPTARPVPSARHADATTQRD